MRLTHVVDQLILDLRNLNFGPPVAHVYNPLLCARPSHYQYLRRFGKKPKQVLLVGMKPGPWGMVQTGVPSGDVAMVPDRLGIEEKLTKPQLEHPTRPVQGLACRRREVGGSRLWGWARGQFGTPDRFFQRFFVASYCPLLLLEDGGGKRAPEKLPAGERVPLLRACDRALRRRVEHFRPKHVIGVGRFAEEQIRRAAAGLSIGTDRILHPSPAGPAANRNWARQTTRGLAPRRPLVTRCSAALRGLAQVETAACGNRHIWRRVRYVAAVCQRHAAGRGYP